MKKPVIGYFLVAIFFLGLINIERISEMLSFLLLDESVQIKPSEKPETLNSEQVETLTMLPVSEWGKDIFYDRRNKFSNHFKLTGITYYQDWCKAIINNKFVIVGDHIDGFKVTDINEHHVLLKRGKYTITLNLEK